MRVTANLNPPQPRARVQDLMMIGRPGRPMMMQKFVANHLRGLGSDQAYNPGTGNIYQGITPGTSSPPNATVGYLGPLILPLNYQQVNGLQSLPAVPSPYYWGISQPYLDNNVSTYYYIVVGPYGPAFVMPGGAPILPLSAAAGLANQVNQTITNPGVTQNAANPNATVATLTYGGGSGTQGGGGNVLSAAPASSTSTLPDSQSQVQSSNTTGTSGGATGNLVNGLPAAGSNAGPDAGGTSTTTTTTDYTPFILVGAAALLMLMMVKK